MRSQYIVVNPGVMPGDADLYHVIKASSVTGGFTVVAAHARAGLVGTLDFVLMNYGTSGTVAGGTVANMASGTATVWAAAVPQSLTLSTTAANLFIDDGEWLVLKKLEAAGGNDPGTNCSIIVEIVPGVVTAG